MQKRYHTLENIIFDAIVYLVMAFVLICCLVPFIYMLAVSFSGTKKRTAIPHRKQPSFTYKNRTLYSFLHV